MSYFNLNAQAKQILRGNMLIIVCCGFYLAWWLLAYRPAKGIGGLKTGWLLILAFVAGLVAVIMIQRGISQTEMKTMLFSDRYLLAAGVVIYLVLLAVTLLIFKRQVTTELLLIVGWAVLTSSEINALYGSGFLSHNVAVVFTVVIIVSAILSLVCYVLYYSLDSWAGYVDGMVPLLLAAAIMLSLIHI